MALDPEGYEAVSQYLERVLAHSAELHEYAGITRKGAAERCEEARQIRARASEQAVTIDTHRWGAFLEASGRRA